MFSMRPAGSFVNRRHIGVTLATAKRRKNEKKSKRWVSGYKFACLPYQSGFISSDTFHSLRGHVLCVYACACVTFSALRMTDHIFIFIFVAFRLSHSLLDLGNAIKIYLYIFGYFLFDNFTMCKFIYHFWFVTRCALGTRCISSL